MRSNGVNDIGCGAFADPCQSVQAGLNEAAALDKREVYVAGGSYAGPIVLRDGVSLYGGFGQNFQRNPLLATGSTLTEITGGEDDDFGGDGQFLTIRAHDLLEPVTVADLTLTGPDATNAGASSYVIHADNAADLRLTRNQIISGDGADGAPGSPGLDASSVVRAAGGQQGGSGAEFVSVCNNSSHGGGGPRGANSTSPTPSTRDMDGGNGGAGGEMDTNCPFGPFTATAGDNGFDADFVSGSIGLKGFGGPANSSGCDTGGGTPGQQGGDGQIANGLSGGGGGAGRTDNGYWFGNNGFTGNTGQNGSGGGGGGGGGGCDEGTDSWGAGGGGGGAGGAAARAGGGGGHGGGGSFGIFAVNNSSIIATDNVFTRGDAGNGGAGGTGGQGQPGGFGGPGGLHPGASAAGVGGDGAHGGHSGGGGGGAGGRSAAIAITPDSVVTLFGSNPISGGAAGLGGPGGVSAPAIQGTLDDDGSDGGAGTGGALTETHVCASLSAC
ncbi:MAG: hypothetical protein WEB00_04695 [Dehalococcoidia bacterium]